MRDFARLFMALDASTATRDKVSALTAFFREAPPEDAAWAAYFLAGGKPRQVVRTGVLRALACREAGIEDWLFEASYQAVGDLAETIAHILPRPAALSTLGLARWIEDRLLPLRDASPDEQAERIAGWWRELDATGRFLLVKLIGGGFRVGASKGLVQRAVAEAADLPPAVVAERMVGYTDARRRPDAQTWRTLTAPATTAVTAPAEADEAAAGAAESTHRGGLPYPFFLAHPLPPGTSPPEAGLGAATQWLAEWKFDGIRAQVVRRQGQVWIWSRGEELVTERFPEVEARAQGWADGTVVDGELLVFDGAGSTWPAPFARLQQRIGRKNLTRRILAEQPVDFMAYDLLELDGQDLRTRPMGERRAMLEAWATATGCRVSPRLDADDWEVLGAQRAAAREQGVEGLMLKHREAPYGIGRRKDASGAGWIKWKLDPMTVDAVLVYAQAGHGRRASLYTDYTFAVWNRPPRDADEAAAALRAPGAAGAGAGAGAAAATGDATAARADGEPPLTLLPVTKAYSGLTDAEILKVDAVIRRTTREKFGPVRSVQPTLLFEIGFEGIQASPRHKSGVALRFPRMLRLREDKPLHEADSLPTLLQLIR